jgi:hypothetical protein
LAAVGSKQRAEKWSCFCRASQAGAAFAAGVALSEVCRWRNCIGPSDWCDMQKFGGGFGVLKITALDVALPRAPSTEQIKLRSPRNGRVFSWFFFSEPCLQAGAWGSNCGPQWCFWGTWEQYVLRAEVCGLFMGYGSVWLNCTNILEGTCIFSGKPTSMQVSQRVG